MDLFIFLLIVRFQTRQVFTYLIVADLRAVIQNQYKNTPEEKFPMKISRSGTSVWLLDFK